MSQLTVTRLIRDSSECLDGKFLYSIASAIIEGIADKRQQIIKDFNNKNIYCETVEIIDRNDKLFSKSYEFLPDVSFLNDYIIKTSKLELIDFSNCSSLNMYIKLSQIPYMFKVLNKSVVLSFKIEDFSKMSNEAFKNIKIMS